MKNFILKQVRKLALCAFALTMILSFSANVAAYTYSGLLDTYDGVDFTTAGRYAIDSFSTYGHAYVQHWTTNQTGSMYVGIGQKTSSGYSLLSKQEVSANSYNELSFSIPSSGTYKMYFQATTNYQPVSFNGKVWDYRQ